MASSKIHDTCSLLSSGLTIRELTAADSDHMLMLQEAVHKALPDNQKASIVIKSKVTFKQLVTTPHFGIGVFSPAQRLIGQLLVGVTIPGHAVGGLSACETSDQLLEKHKTVGIVQSVLVHSEWRGKGVMDLMLRPAEAIAAERKLVALVAEVASYNRASATGFQRQGYVEAGRGFDPQDGTPLIFLERQIAGSGMASAAKLQMLLRPNKVNDGTALTS